MLKFLFFIVLFYLISRYIRRMFLPSPGQKKHFNNYGKRSRRGRRHIDQIEEADFEDISDKNK